MLTRQEQRLLAAVAVLIVLGLGWLAVAKLRAATAFTDSAPYSADEAPWAGPEPHGDGGSQGTSSPAPARKPAEEDEATAPEAVGGAAQSITVHVAGAVAQPGVYQLEAGARVIDALRAAGGPTPEAAPDALNLAAVVHDAMRIEVPTRQEVEAGLVTAAPAHGPGQGAPLDVNAATAAQLEALPGIGPVLAQRIVADRQENGPFRSLDDLLRVPGIGPKLLETIRPYLVAPR